MLSSPRAEGQLPRLPLQIYLLPPILNCRLCPDLSHSLCPASFSCLFTECPCFLWALPLMPPASGLSLCSYPKAFPSAAALPSPAPWNQNLCPCLMIQAHSLWRQHREDNANSPQTCQTVSPPYHNLSLRQSCFPAWKLGWVELILGCTQQQTLLF